MSKLRKRDYTESKNRNLYIEYSNTNEYYKELNSVAYKSGIKLKYKRNILYSYYNKICNNFGFKLDTFELLEYNLFFIKYLVLSSIVIILILKLISV